MTNNKGRCPYYNEDCPKCCKSTKQGEGEWEKDFDDLILKKRISFIKEWKRTESLPLDYSNLESYPRELIKNFIRSLLSNTERRVREETLKECLKEVSDVEAQYEHEYDTPESRSGFTGAICHVEWAIKYLLTNKGK